MQEPVAIFPGQLKLGRQREHGLVEVSEHGFDRGGVFMAVVDVVVEADELPVGEKIQTLVHVLLMSRTWKMLKGKTGLC